MYRSPFAFALAALAAIFLPSFLQAQITFQRTYGGTGYDAGSEVRQTTDGGYVVAGITSSSGAGDHDSYLVKTNANGDTLWTRTFGSRLYDQGCSVAPTADGGYIITGVADSIGAGDYDVYLVKTDAQGDTLWTRTFGGDTCDWGKSVRQTADGGYVIAAETWSFGAGLTDVYLIRTDGAGDTLWTRTFGGANYEEVYSVQQTADGGYIIAGSTSSFGAGGDVYLIKTNANGDTQWTRTFGGTASDGGNSVQQTSDGGYIVTGTTSSFGTGSDVYLIRTNPDGETLWTRTFGGAGSDCGYSVCQTAGGGYIIAGFTTSFGAGGVDVYLIKTDSSGDTLWTKTFGGADYDMSSSVQQTADGGYIVTGTTASSGAGGNDVYLIKTDSLGRVAVTEPKTSPTRASALSLSCEPNPTSGTTRISLARQASSFKPLTLNICDAQGRIVRSISSLLPPLSYPLPELGRNR
jgi:hypothetical protein